MPLSTDLLTHLHRARPNQTSPTLTLGVRRPTRPARTRFNHTGPHHLQGLGSQEVRGFKSHLLHQVPCSGTRNSGRWIRPSLHPRDIPARLLADASARLDARRLARVSLSVQPSSIHRVRDGAQISRIEMRVCPQEDRRIVSERSGRDRGPTAQGGQVGPEPLRRKQRRSGSWRCYAVDFSRGTVQRDSLLLDAPSCPVGRASELHLR